jgi:hypothetical protein
MSTQAGVGNPILPSRREDGDSASSLWCGYRRASRWLLPLPQNEKRPNSAVDELMRRIASWVS